MSAETPDVRRDSGCPLRLGDVRRDSGCPPRFGDVRRDSGCPPRLGMSAETRGCPLRLGMSAETRGCPLARPEATDDVVVVVNTATVVEYLIRYTRFVTAILILTIFRPDISDICARKQFKYEYNVYLLVLVKFFRNRRQVNVFSGMYHFTKHPFCSVSNAFNAFAIHILVVATHIFVCAQHLFF